MFCCVNNAMYLSIRMFYSVKIGTQKNNTVSYEVFITTDRIVLQIRSAPFELQVLLFMLMFAFCDCMIQTSISVSHFEGD